MGRRTLSYLAVVLTSMALTAIFATSVAQGQGGCQIFNETGKTVCGRFLQYWQQNGGLAQQGFPLTNEFTEVSDLNGQSYTVQYFERAVFEKHPENKAPYDVLLSQLGKFQFDKKYNGVDPAPAPVITSTVQPAGTLLRTLSGHTDFVWTATFSPDGQTLASGGFDNSVKLWRVSDGSEVLTLSGHTDWVNSVAFSPDGQTLASASDDETVKLWQVSDGSEIRTLTDDTSFVLSVVFSPDGQTLASGSLDDTIRLWKVSDGSLVNTLSGHDGPVTSVAFSPDGQMLASGSWDDTVKLWRVSDGSEVLTLSGHTNEVESVAFSPDGQTLASASRDKTVKLWQVSDGSEVLTLSGHNDEVKSVAFSPDGQTLASAAVIEVRLWQVSDGTLVSTLADGGIFVALSPDGQMLASNSLDDVGLWSTGQGGCQIFNETGKTVCGRFLQYWQQNGGLAQQGFPLTNEFTEVSDLNGQSYTVQYFERAVFEKHPENKAPYDVLLSQLGRFQFDKKYNGVDPAPPIVSTPTSTPDTSQEPPRIPLQAFKALYDDPAKRPLILDARSVEAYKEGHIKGAISFPLFDAEQRVNELPRDKLIVAYCQ